jgi:N-acetylmuramoyl-L-alanine amidase
MTEGERDSDRGGVYRATLAAPRPPAAPRLAPVYFRLSGSRDGIPATHEIRSRLRVATLPPRKQLWGSVTANLATFFKNGSAGNVERWGNFIRGTPFPIRDGHGERVQTDFGKGEAGWLEYDATQLDKTFQKHSLPSLRRPRIAVTRQALTLAWPTVSHPVACVFYADPLPGGETELRISLPGAGDLHKFSSTLKQDGFVAVEGTSARRDSAPLIRVRLSRPLWGYAMTCDASHGLRLVIRTRPGAGAPGKPLAGLRIMLDAGHGGVSSGERGPSGLLEKDINLVQAAWLEKALAALGATVKQVRRGDVDIDLDARVDAALAWNPDIFISLHHNSVGGSADPLSDTGPISFYHYAYSKPLADAIADSMARRLGAEKGPRSRANIFRVNRNISLCPAVLIESAYICNPHDEIKLRQADALKASADAIAQGVKNLFAR